MSPLAATFARNLRNQRARRKLSQQELAGRAGISVSYVSMLEHEQRTPPLETIERLAKALAVAPVSLLEGAAPGRY